MSWMHRGVRLLYPHGSVRHVLRGYLCGYRFEVVAGMGLTYALGFNHLNFCFLAGRIKPGETVYDVGANCGQMSLFFAERTIPGGRVLAFEPMAENVVRLRRNLALNGVNRCGFLKSQLRKMIFPDASTSIQARIRQAACRNPEHTECIPRKSGRLTACAWMVCWPRGRCRRT